MKENVEHQFVLKPNNWWVICSQGTCVNLSTLDRVSPLHGACAGGHLACADLLIQNGANVSTAASTPDDLGGRQVVVLLSRVSEGHVGRSSRASEMENHQF